MIFLLWGIPIQLLWVARMIWTSTLGYVVKMSGQFFKNVKQTRIAFSNMQAEFAACHEVTIQTIWSNNFVSGYKLLILFRILKIFFVPKNSSMMFYSKNDNRSSCRKSILIYYLVVGNKFKAWQTVIKHINRQMIVHSLTKGLVSKPY